jgi:hypothetical protein
MQHKFDLYLGKGREVVSLCWFIEEMGKRELRIACPPRLTGGVEKMESQIERSERRFSIFRLKKLWTHSPLCGLIN